MSKKKKTPTQKLLYTGAAIIAIFGLGVILAKSMGWIGAQNAGKQVEATEAKLKTITQIVSASGKMQPEVEVILRPEVSGEIIALPIREGDYVSKGDLLVRIKPDIYQARIDEINAALLTQKARREQARAGLLEAEAMYKQNKQLYEQEAISETEFIQSTSAYEAQKANFKATEYQVQSMQAQLKQANEELQKTIIRAPRQGTVSKLAVEVGERVLGTGQAIGTELLRIAKMDQMEVQVEVNENDIVNVSTGDSANIEVDAYPERIFKGVVTEIANSAEITGTGTNEQVTNYEVKVRVSTSHNLDMSGGELVERSSEELPEGAFTPSFKPGMSATVDVQTQTVFNVVSVPIQAVTVRDFADSQLHKSDSTGTDSTTVDDDLIIPQEDLRKVVFIITDDKADRREVKTGISDNTHIQILSGVDAGQQVVTGSYRLLSKDLKDGDRVKVNSNSVSQLASN